MTHHIVMFRFRDDVPADVRRAAREAFKQGIEALPATIPFIKSVHVGFNINEAEQVRWFRPEDEARIFALVDEALGGGVFDPGRIIYDRPL